MCKRAVRGTRCKYLGTYSAWGGPSTTTWDDKTQKYDTAFVANTKTIEDEGEHWVLFYLPADESKKPYMFDSFARNPKEMGRPLWRKYMNTIAYKRGQPDWNRNHVKMQEHHTQVCGQLCAYVLRLLAHGKSVPKTIVKENTIIQFLQDMAHMRE